jgi:hypothetical protein
MPSPTQLRLGDNADTIARKKGLTPEYYYKGEPVAVVDPSDTSRRIIGEVLSLTGDVMTDGVMTVGIGNNSNDLRIPYTDVSNSISKLIGNYCISEALSMSTEDRAGPSNSVVVEQQRLIESEISQTIEVQISRAMSILNRSMDDRLAQMKERLQLDHANIEKISWDMSAIRNDRLAHNQEISQMKEAIEKMSPGMSNTYNRPDQMQEGMGGATKVSAIGKQPVIMELSNVCIEEALRKLSSKPQSCPVTRDVLKLLQELNQQKSMEKVMAWMISDNQPSMHQSGQGRPCSESAWLELPDLSSKSDKEMDRFLHLQTMNVSESNLKGLAKLFLNVCLGKIDEDVVDKFCNSAQITAPYNVAQLVSTFSCWLKEVLSRQPSGQVKSNSQPKTQQTLDKERNFLRSILDEIALAKIREQEKQNSYCKNAEQVAMISKPFTIWHAVGSFGSPEGKACWHVVRMVVRFLVDHKIECPWMDGTERGVFGETPLHIALLFNNAENTDWRFHEMFNDLWDMCPQLHDAEYKDELYKGENILHLAIIRNSGTSVIDKILSSAKIKILLKQQAVGSFFQESWLSHGYCNLLGEYPHFFAACSYKFEIFKCLIEHGADLELTATRKQHNLLHLMILNDSSRTRRKKKEEQKCELLHQYKILAEYLSNRGKLEKMEENLNADGYSPLMLAAAEGSVKMFIHLFDDGKIESAWNYGGITCKKMYLNGVDVPLPEKNHTQTRMSILEILVLKERKDILSSSQIDKLVETKWEKYGCLIFYRKLGVTIFVTVAFFLLPMTKIKTSLQWRILHTISHAVTAFVAEYLCQGEDVSPDSLIHRFIFRTWDKENLTANTLLSQFCTDIVRWVIHPIMILSQVPTLVIAWTEQAASLFCFVVLPEEGLHQWFTVHWVCNHTLHICELSFVLCRRLIKPILNWDAERRAADIVPFVSRVFLIMFVIRVCLQPSPVASSCAVTGRDTPVLLSLIDAMLYSVLRFLLSIEALLYSAIGLASFASVASLFMVFEGCGSFLLMVFRVLSRDLPIFVAIYSIVLLMFAHSHYLASNRLHAGVGEGMDSMWSIFSAMLGSFPDEKELNEEKEQEPTLNSLFITGITVTNYFLVAVVSILSSHSIQTY